MKYIFYVFGFFLAFTSLLKPTYAIPPPDFLFNIGSQIAQVFSILVLFFSAILAVMKDYIKVVFAKFGHKNLLLAVLTLVIIAISFAGAYFYENHRQEKALKDWKEANQESIAEELNVVEKGDEAVEDEIVPEVQLNPEVSIDNEAFEAVLGQNPYILDAREDEEFEIGNIQGSIHIRFADLVDGRWKELPTDREVYVLCWSGIRGKEVTEFLRSKGVNARYLKEGADGWVSWGGDWNGEIKFSHVYKAERYNKILSLTEFANEIDSGVFIVDSREKDQYDEWHIENSLNIPIIYTASDDIDALMNTVPPASKVVTVCDGWVSCFDAKITGVKLEKRGHTFIGRFDNLPEYKNDR